MVKKRRLGNSSLSPSSSRIKLESNSSGSLRHITRLRSIIVTKTKKTIKQINEHCGDKITLIGIKTPNHKTRKKTITTQLNCIDDVMLARDRLKGALEDLMVQSDDDSDSSQDETPLSPPPIKPPPVIKSPTKKEPRVIQRRRRRKDPDLDMAFHHTYVMKLYDRSVDLAQFLEDTPLYPICRAWMANQPRTPYHATKRSPTPEPKTEQEDSQEPTTTRTNFSDSDSDSEFIKDIFKLPPPSLTGIRMRIPTPEPVELKGFTLNSEGDALPMKENLLREHLERWGQIRRNWLSAACENEARYSESGKILTTIYKRAQKAFQ